MAPYEVWLADCGFSGKVRPILILTMPQDNDARNLVIALPLTSQIRGLRGEVSIGKPKWLSKPSVINIQAIASIDRSKLIRKMGSLSTAQTEKLKQEIRQYLML
jgi:mRNA interferase MazF